MDRGTPSGLKSGLDVINKGPRLALFSQKQALGQGLGVTRFIRGNQMGLELKEPQECNFRSPNLGLIPWRALGCKQHLTLSFDFCPEAEELGFYTHSVQLLATSY